MPPFAYPLIGFVAGMIGGWFWQNIKPGLIAAFLITLSAGSISIALNGADGLDYFIVSLSVFVAMLTSFFGSVAGVRIKDSLERNSK